MIPPRGATVRRPSRQIEPVWYVVCRFTVNRDEDGELLAWPASVAHAKQMGGIVTACGQNSTTLNRLFHVRFPAPGADNCAACMDVVAGGG